METQIPQANEVNYNAILATVADRGSDEIIAFMVEEFPHLWMEAYLVMTPRQTDIYRIRLGSFEYVYDDYATLAARRVVPYDSEAEARLVAVFGRSAPRDRTRDDYRLRRWVGPTEANFGKSWDKGHFIAHSIGGAVDRAEVNVFVQRRHLNRGWSSEGIRYRKMEKYCRLHPGTFCFNRPLYTNGSAKPTFIEFGLFTVENRLWVEYFDNS